MKAWVRRMYQLSNGSLIELNIFFDLGLAHPQVFRSEGQVLVLVLHASHLALYTICFTSTFFYISLIHYYAYIKL